MLLIALILFVALPLFSHYTKTLVNPVRRGAPPTGISEVRSLYQHLLIADNARCFFALQQSSDGAQLARTG
ncbi:MAG: hypothetical protein GYA58_08095 [Anaerolineaceae bacterium]|nr:hypothetical protein [Anaerolineaceae bacterium]